MVDERRRQDALDALGVLDTPPDERVDRIARLAQEAFGVPMVSVSLIDRDRQWSKSQIGLGTNEFPREHSFCNQSVKADAPLIVEDATRSQLFAANPYVVGDPNVRFYAGHPLRAPGGEPIGTLCIVDVRPRQFDEAQKSLLEDLALWVQTEIAKDDELDQAALIQRTLRPRQHPEVPGFSIAAGAVAHRQLTGDFYDLSLQGNSLRITLADAMGKGTGPALVAATARGSLRTEPDRPLSEAVAEADRLLIDDLADMTMFVTAVLARIDIDSGTLDIVDAGHSLAFILRADRDWVHLRSTGLPLGMGMTDDERRPMTTTLGPGDAFLCCSDGLLDVLDPVDPFSQVAEVLARRGPQGAVDEALRLARTDSAIDDVTVIVVRRET